MMDKGYILDNGILEMYLLGELTDDEQLQVESILKSDDELKNVFQDLEESFEKLAFENALNPPSAIKSNLIAEVKASKIKTIPLESSNPYKLYLYVASGIAACLLIGMFYMFTQLKSTNEQLQIVEEQNNYLLKDVESLKNNLDETSQYADLIDSPHTEQYILKGNDIAPNAKVISYVNHESKMVVINTKELPKLDTEHDYQMWADVEGEMINMGVIDKEKSLLAMNYIDNAESLNITIEPAGGNDHPTVSRLVTNVYLR